jgi:hypothetical protein
MGLLGDALLGGVSAAFNTGLEHVQTNEKYEMAMQQLRDKIQMDNENRESLRVAKQDRIRGIADEMVGGHQRDLDTTAETYKGNLARNEMTPEAFEAANGALANMRGLLSQNRGRMNPEDMMMAEALDESDFSKVAQMQMSKDAAAERRADKEDQAAAIKAYRDEQLALQREKFEELKGRMASKGGAGASGGKSSAADFSFDADKESKRASALVGLNSNELKLYDDPEKFDALPKQRQAQIEAKIRQRDALVKAGATSNAPVDAVYRYLAKRSAEAKPATDAGTQGSGAATGKPADPPKPTISPVDGYDHANKTQYKHVLDNLNVPSLRATAEAWLSDSLPAWKRNEIKSALGIR